MKNWAQRTFESMTIDQKLGQLMISYLDNEQDIKDLVRKGALGGLFSVHGETVREVAEWVAEIQTEAQIPLLICSDFEAGNTFAGGTRLPSNMAIGATGNPELARKAGQITAREVKAMGFGVMGAPVVDINNNPRNPIINIRSYGEDPSLASRMAVAYLEGVQSEGVFACLKHFPGSGDMEVDTHRLLPVLPYGMERMERIELVPFRAGIAAGVKSIMTTHIIFSALDAEYPATLSHPILTDLLRSRMGFQGIILSDALQMHAIAHNYEFDQAVAMAVEAGCDAIILSEPVRTLEALKKAYTDGRLSEARVAESVQRILVAKEELGLPGSIVDPAEAERIAQNPEHQILARRIAEASIACLADPDQLLPLTSGRSGKVAVVTVSNYESRRENPAEWRQFEQDLRKKFSVAEVFHVTQASRPQIDPNAFDTFLVGVFVRLLAFEQEGGILPAALKVVLQDLLRRGRRTFVLSFGNPYPMAEVLGLKGCLCAFSDCEVSINAVVNVLTGEHPAKGEMPASFKR